MVCKILNGYDPSSEHLLNTVTNSVTRGDNFQSNWKKNCFYLYWFWRGLCYGGNENLHNYSLKNSYTNMV